MINNKLYLIFSIVCLICLSCVAGCSDTNFLENAIGINKTTPTQPTVVPATVTTTITTVVTTQAPTIVSTPVDLPTTIVEPTRVIPDNKLIINYINVGQGDSELIVSPSGKTMLIDAGEDSDAEQIIPMLKNTTIDVVVITHPHSDHIGGMQTILSKYNISKFYDSGYPYTTAMYTNMMKSVTANNISYTSVKTGKYIDFDPEVNVSVINPQNKFFNELNDNSVVLLIKYKNESFLFTGDAGLNAESLYAKNLGKIDILKVSHHGSVTGTGAYLISKTHPTTSIISVGVNNNYGHPDLSTLNKLHKDGSTIYRTDLNGTIIVTSNGEKSIITTE